MPRSIILKLAALAGVAALAIAGVTSASAWRTSFQTDPDLTRPGLWVGTVPPYAIGNHVVRWCWDSRNATYVTRSDVTGAANAWNNAVGAWAFFEDGGDCTPSSSVCDSGKPTDGSWRIYVRDLGANGESGKTCITFNGESGAGTGQINEADMWVNDDAVGGVSDPTLQRQFARWLLLHEMGHMVGLDHPCGDPNAVGQPDICDGLYGDCNAASGYAVMCDWFENGQADPHNCISAISQCQVPKTDDVNGIKAMYRDGDADGCVGGEERGNNAVFGGLRNDSKSNDFTDWTGDGKVDFADTNLALNEHYGHGLGSSPWDALDAKFDVAPGATYSNPGTGDHLIDMTDALYSLTMFGHSCRTEP